MSAAFVTACWCTFVLLAASLLQTASSASLAASSALMVSFSALLAASVMIFLSLFQPVTLCE